MPTSTSASAASKLLSAPSTGPNSVRCRQATGPAATTSTAMPSISAGSRTRASRSRTSSTRCARDTLGRNSPTSITVGAADARREPCSSRTWSDSTPVPRLASGVRQRSMSGAIVSMSSSSWTSAARSGKSKAHDSCGSDSPPGGVIGSATVPRNSASRRESRGGNRAARLFPVSRSAPPIESMPTSPRREMVAMSRRSADTGKPASSAVASPFGTIAHRRRLRTAVRRTPPAGSSACLCGTTATVVPTAPGGASMSVWCAAAHAAEHVSATAARACRPRAANVQTAVRTSDASPPKKPAVPVTSR